MCVLYMLCVPFVPCRESIRMQAFTLSWGPYFTKHSTNTAFMFKHIVWRPPGMWIFRRFCAAIVANDRARPMSPCALVYMIINFPTVYIQMCVLHTFPSMSLSLIQRAYNLLMSNKLIDSCVRLLTTFLIYHTITTPHIYCTDTRQFICGDLRWLWMKSCPHVIYTLWVACFAWIMLSRHRRTLSLIV